MSLETTQSQPGQSRPARRLALYALVALIAVLAIVAAILWSQDDEPAAGGGAGGSGTPGGTTVTKPIHIETVDIRIAESYPPQLFAEVTGYLPDGCTVPLDPEISRSDNTITVTILGERDPDAMCTQVLIDYHKNIPLGSVDPGEYTVIVNDHSQTITVQ